jgi:predicted nuclease of restriction endonuclease-like RecB superfamily
VKNYGMNMGRLVRDKQRYRSMLEVLISKTLGDKMVSYEADKFTYTVPASKHTYTPDFKLSDTKYLEAKGIWDATDRAKMKLVKAQYPDITFYMLFQNAHKKLSKTSKTTYAMWAEKNGFQWGHFPSGIPKHWLEDL